MHTEDPDDGPAWVGWIICPLLPFACYWSALLIAAGLEWLTVHLVDLLSP